MREPTSFDDIELENVHQSQDAASSIKEHVHPGEHGAASIRAETLSTNNQQDILSSLPPPPPFDLRVANLTVGVPPPSLYLPLPIPIPIPSFLRKAAPSDEPPKAILTDVSAECHAGEMLAM